MYISPVVKQLLILNILLFVGDQIFDLDFLALRYPGSEEFQPIQIVSHFFMHGGIAHIFFNMFALVTFGSALEMRWGPKRFLFFYLFCAFGAAALHMGVLHFEISHLQNLVSAFNENPNYTTFNQFFEKVPMNQLNPEYTEMVDKMGELVDQSPAEVAAQITSAMEQWITAKENIPVVGASGAIYGLLLGFGMLFPNQELMLMFLPVPVKAKYFIPVLMLIELFLGVNQFSWDNIAHFAHLGGALFGLLLILYWRRRGEM